MTKQETTGRALPIQLDPEATEESAARTSYLLAWADAEERERRTYPGADLDDVAPAETPEPFREWAREMLTAALGATTVGDGIAEAWARAAIGGGVWAFRPEFVAGDVPDGIDADTLQAIQDERCEDAIAADGRGHFLSHFDGEEREGDEFYVFRTN